MSQINVICEFLIRRKNKKKKNVLKTNFELGHKSTLKIPKIEHQKTSIQLSVYEFSIKHI